MLPSLRGVTQRTISAREWGGEWLQFRLHRCFLTDVGRGMNSYRRRASVLISASPVGRLRGKDRMVSGLLCRRDPRRDEGPSPSPEMALHARTARRRRRSRIQPGMVLAVLWNEECRRVPKNNTAPKMAKVIMEIMRAYSTAVAPRSRMLWVRSARCVWILMSQSFMVNQA